MAGEDRNCQRLSDRWGWESLNGLDGLKVAGGLELHLVGQWMNLATVDFGHKLVSGLLGPAFSVHREEHCEGNWYPSTK